MKYFLHTTSMAQRLKTFKGASKVINIRMDDFIGRTLAFDEGNGSNLYWVDYSPMLETLKQFDLGITEPKETAYYKRWASIKGEDSCKNRILNFLELYKSIKKDGLREPVAVSSCGQKLDGSHRAAVMKYLGHETIPARELQIPWQELDANFFVRTALAREKLYGLNYYYIDFGFFKNIEKIPVYSENSYDRWEVLKDLVGRGKVLDVGCNEGFISIMTALQGAEVTGVDHEFIEGANFHKLAFEFRNEKNITVKFKEGDISNLEIENYDTVLLLNVIYHIKDQVSVMKKLRNNCKRLIMQGNLRKAHEVDKFNGCTVPTMVKLCEETGWKVEKTIEWRDKPIIICV